MQSTCIPDEQLVSGDMCPSTYMYPDTCCSSGTHVSGRRVSWCNWKQNILVIKLVNDWYIMFVSERRKAAVVILIHRLLRQGEQFLRDGKTFRRFRQTPSVHRCRAAARRRRKTAEGCLSRRRRQSNDRWPTGSRPRPRRPSYRQQGSSIHSTLGKLHPVLQLSKTLKTSLPQLPPAKVKVFYLFIYEFTVEQSDNKI